MHWVERERGVYGTNEIMNLEIRGVMGGMNAW